MSRFALAVCGTMLLMQNVACASIIHYNDADRAAWFEDAGLVTTIGFTELDEFQQVTDQYSDLGVLFTSPNYIGLFDLEDFSIDGWGLFSGNGGGIWMDFDAERSWIGVDHLGSMQFVLFRDGVQVAESQEFIHSGPGHFAGIYSSEPFDRVWLTDFDGSVAIDDLHFGMPVPAPGVVSMVACALWPHRRRRRDA